MGRVEKAGNLMLPELERIITLLIAGPGSAAPVPELTHMLRMKSRGADVGY